MKEAVVVTAIVLSFSTFVTVHVSVAVRLMLQQRPRWRGLVALLVPPLGVIWALRAGWKRSAALWFGAVVVYVIALIAALA